ncbi:hypothetical protein ABE525_04700 [Pseudomonas wadenswilerensis]|jgi:hypothetical protein|uniref:Putative membrane protein n=1 Tax=Pseudomonas wadenswilerensis TaxID=1785161 RepID=A0A380T6L9_9PSED|nr:hypothetical protein [Pseudomonas]MCE5984071.1 hypothetical protein [Pseudomonas sp. LF19]UVM22793.1 hypothetical protein LOY45_04260 [Pseudomonas wadenswilerensis]SPO68598.1 conserved membrane protein of unknown function [Pseudomonas sp. JV241A]SUQ65198.1 putative membrane protein [Pseudomonas wadenswilerensis]
MARFYVAITLALYLLSLCFDAIYLSGDSRLHALQAMLYGPWGIVMQVFSWFANPLLGLAIITHRRWRWLSLVLGLGALYLALSSLLVERLPNNQSYDFLDVTGFGPGYYLWLASISFFCAAQAWWCRQVLKGAQMPGWHWLDGGLAIVLNITIVYAIQTPSLHFQLKKVIEPPPPIQIDKDAI